ncbi:MAG: hypothetical protein LBH54_00915 [Clostridiales bacterium]|jgi:predicted nuclease with TOPRIM domain|nr:hypothetical protein [Clostridiales bacterium]
MKIKPKFIWLYSVLLFSAALLLILISTLSQSRLTPRGAVTETDEQQAFNQTIQQSMTDLIRENENLRESLSEANDKIDRLESESQALATDTTARSASGEATDFLLQAELLFNIGEYADSMDALQNVNALILSEQGKDLYTWLTDKLAAKGYKLQG